MATTSFVFFIFLVFGGGALLATAALYTRQSLLVAYILLGLLLGPSGFKLVPDIALARQIGDVGIIFLLFLLGLELNPFELLNTFRRTTVITIGSSLIFCALGVVVGYLFGYTFLECLLIGVACMFSSTAVGLKLLPKKLHHQVVGEWMISILLLQDIFAIVFLIVINDVSLTGSRIVDIALATITLPALVGFAFFIQHYVISRLFKRFSKTKEYVFLLALGWCLGLAELAEVIGLPGEIGAFIAGVSIAEGPIAVYISESLKPLRDFCLVMFFFVLGASFNLQFLPVVWAPALFLAGIMLFVKPLVFSFLLQKSAVDKPIANEVGLRLGQSSEFALLIAYLAAVNVPWAVSQQVNYMVEAMTMLTFFVSSYLVVLRFPRTVRTY